MPNASDESLLLIGHITRPHGIKGELRLEYYAQSTEWIEKSKVSPSLSEQTGLYLRKKNTLRPIVISSWREINTDEHSLTDTKHFIIRIQGVDDRNAAELLRQNELLIEERIILQAGQDVLEQAPFLHQIEGMEVFSQKDDNFDHIGTIEEIIFPAGQEMWCIRSLAGHEILFPAIDIFVDRYDLENRHVYICPPEGLLEIYTEESEKNRDKNKHTKSSSKKNLQ